MKVQDLSNDQIDFLVAKIEGIEHPRTIRKMEPGFVMVPYQEWYEDGSVTRYRTYSPTSDWNIYGEIILRDGICVAKFYEPVDGVIKPGSEWAAISLDDTIRCDGDDPRVAAMRVHITKHYGVDVPAETFV